MGYALWHLCVDYSSGAITPRWLGSTSSSTWTYQGAGLAWPGLVSPDPGPPPSLEQRGEGGKASKKEASGKRTRDYMCKVSSKRWGDREDTGAVSEELQRIAERGLKENRIISVRFMNPSLKPSGSKTEIVNTDILFFYYLMFLSPRAECSVARCVQMSKIWSKAAEGNLLCYFYSCFYSQVEQGKIWIRLTTAHVIYIKCSSIISGASLINMSSDVLKLRLRFVSRCWVYSGVKPGDTCIIWMGRIFYFSFLHIVSRIYVPNCNTPS